MPSIDWSPTFSNELANHLHAELRFSSVFFCVLSSMEELPLAYNISFDAWVIDVGATSLGAISVSCAPPSRSVSPGRSRPRPLLPRFWRSVRRSLGRHWWGRCKPCGGASWMATVDEEPPGRRPGRSLPASGAGCYSQMPCQDRDEKLEEAISYCKRTMAGDATSSPRASLTPMK